MHGVKYACTVQVVEMSAQRKSMNPGSVYTKYSIQALGVHVHVANLSKFRCSAVSVLANLQGSL